MLKESAKFGPGFIIVARILECKSRWVNLIDRDVDVHVVRIVVDHAYALVFSVAERFVSDAKLFANRSALFANDAESAMIACSLL